MAKNVRIAIFLEFFSSCHNKTMMELYQLLRTWIVQITGNIIWIRLGLKIIIVWIRPSCMFWSSFYPIFTLDIDFFFIEDIFTSTWCSWCSLNFHVPFIYIFFQSILSSEVYVCHNGIAQKLIRLNSLYIGCKIRRLLLLKLKTELKIHKS